MQIRTRFLNRRLGSIRRFLNRQFFFNVVNCRSIVTLKLLTPISQFRVFFNSDSVFSHLRLSERFCSSFVLSSPYTKVSDDSLVCLRRFMRSLLFSEKALVYKTLGSFSWCISSFEHIRKVFSSVAVLFPVLSVFRLNIFNCSRFCYYRMSYGMGQFFYHSPLFINKVSSAVSFLLVHLCVVFFYYYYYLFALCLFHCRSLFKVVVV